MTGAGGPPAPERRRWLWWPALVLLLAAVVTAVIDNATAPPRPAPPAGHVRHGYGPASHAAAVMRADQDVLLGEERVARAPGDWVFQEYLAQALLARARLTGSYADLARADAALARGLAAAPPGTGPWLAAAAGAMAVHRLAPVAALLDKLDTAAVPGGSDERADVLALRGDLHFYRGDYVAARRAYGAAARLANGPGIAVRLAQWYAKRADFDAALAQIAAALALAKAPTRLFHANLLLQSGSIRLARGDWPGAAADFASADAVFPGDWHIIAARAQMAAAAGDTAHAAALYHQLVDHAAAPPPEVMDALAALYRSSGDVVASRNWAARAGAAWAARLQLLPTAAVGHALEHELVFGTPARALALARQNVAARPYGEALVLLAQAQVQAGDPAGAVATLAQVEASGWRGAPQYAQLANALALLGDGAGADAARARALAINPRAFDPALALLWTGNH